MQKNPHIVIQDVGEKTITVNVNGQVQELAKKLDDLIQLVQSQKSQHFQTADKIYNIGSIGEANFSLLLDKLTHSHQLPSGLLEHLISTDNLIDDEIWAKNTFRIESLKDELMDYGVAISQSNRPMEIFQYYGWLIEEFLRKMMTDISQENPLLRLEYMAEAYQSSLRYLAYIQLAQIIARPDIVNAPSIEAFFNLSELELRHFDFLNFLLTSKQLLQNEANFVTEMPKFISEISDKDSDVYQTALFLEKHRNKLLKNEIVEDRNLKKLSDEYFTALIYWLESIAFLAQYRLVSIKDIYLNYNMGTARNFIHSFGELHNIYKKIANQDTDLKQKAIQDVYTYSNSVLFFRGNNIDSCLEKLNEENSYISLSPLIIDKSVWAKNEKQTPDVYYYSGKNKKEYVFANYANEFIKDNQTEPKSNQKINIGKQDQEKLNSKKLYKQIELILQPTAN